MEDVDKGLRIEHDPSYHTADSKGMIWDSDSYLSKIERKFPNALFAVNFSLPKLSLPPLHCLQAPPA